MPSLFAASITMLFSGTSTGLPSISRWIMRSLDQAFPVLDVMPEFVVEMLDEGAYRHRRGVAQRADGAALDVVRHRIERVQIVGPALAVLDAMDHAIQPAGAFAAGRALAAGFLEIEIGQP